MGPAVLPVLVLLLTGCFAPAFALDVVPFYLTNQSPVVQIFGLPPAQGGRLVPAGRVAGRLVVNVANNFTHEASPREAILLDGETYRFVLALRCGLTERVEIGLDVPYVVHDGGFLDGFIDGFHDAFGFPQGGRDDVEDNRLTYAYVRDGEIRFLIDDATGGIGDLLLSGGFRLLGGGGGKRSLALRAALKLPTGDHDQLRGSGSTDFSLRLAAEDGDSLASWHLTVYGAAGGMLLSDGDVLPSQQRNLAAFATLGIAWQPLAWLALKAQLDGHTPFYGESRLKQLDSASAQLTLGGTLGLPGGVDLDIGVGEDIVVGTAPDVVFHFALGKSF